MLIKFDSSTDYVINADKGARYIFSLDGFDYHYVDNTFDLEASTAVIANAEEVPDIRERIKSGGFKRLVTNIRDLQDKLYSEYPQYKSYLDAIQMIEMGHVLIDNSDADIEQHLKLRFEEFIAQYKDTAEVLQVQLGLLESNVDNILSLEEV